MQVTGLLRVLADELSNAAIILREAAQSRQVWSGPLTTDRWDRQATDVAFDIPEWLLGKTSNAFHLVRNWQMTAERIREEGNRKADWLGAAGLQLVEKGELPLRNSAVGSLVDLVPVSPRTKRRSSPVTLECLRKPRRTSRSSPATRSGGGSGNGDSGKPFPSRSGSYWLALSSRSPYKRSRIGVQAV